MIFDAERQALESRFETNWSETKVKWPNVKFSSSGESEWVAFHNIPTVSKIKSFGSNQAVYRYFGNIVIQIFVTPNSGANRALQLAELVTDIWIGAKFNGITVQSTSIKTTGIIEGWYQVDVISPYYRDSFETRSVL